MKENTVAKFHKVSFEQYLADVINKDVNITEEEINTLQIEYENIVLPKRSTTGSAGYDFVSPTDFVLEPFRIITIPTGIKCYIEGNWVLMLYPRSSLGFKYQVGLVNTVGVIDCDYYNNPNNEGHIMIKFVNNGNKTLGVKAGDRIVQGVFLPFGVTVDDDASGERDGGIGSTGK